MQQRDEQITKPLAEKSAVESQHTEEPSVVPTPTILVQFPASLGYMVRSCLKNKLKVSLGA